MKKPMLKDSLKFLYEHEKTLNYKENHVKRVSRVSVMGGVLVLAFLPVIFCNEWHWSEKNRMTKNNFPVI